MLRISLAFIVIFTTQLLLGQESSNVMDAQFDQTIKSYLRFSVPIISCSTLAANYDRYVILDTRSEEEFQVSHLKGARFAGYDDFKIESWQHLPKDQPIMVYCSIGYRSEKIGEILKRQGFTQVFNLYGSIFEWVNRGNQLFDAKDQSTTKLHTYNQKWSKWVSAKHIEKVW